MSAKLGIALACIILCGALFAGALYLLWRGARRELVGDDEHERPSRLAALQSLFEARVERFFVSPPSWRAVWRLPHLRSILTGIASASLIAAAGWAVWTHAGSWLASTPAVVSTAPPGLPWENFYDSSKTLLRTSCYLMGLVSLIVAGAKLMSEQSGGFTALSLALAMATVPTVLDVMSAPFPVTINDDQPASASSTQAGLSVAHPPVNASADETPARANTQDAAVPSEINGAAQDEEDEAVASHHAPSPQSSGAHGDFGIGDAVMLYGAYKLLSGDGHDTARSTSSHPSASHWTNPAPGAGTQATAGATRMMSHSPATSAPRTTPTYTPAPGRVSAIRTSAGTARASRSTSSRSHR